jgi:hypothetical protein
MNNNSILIDRYLQNEMGADEKAVFENQLAADKNLLEELAMQQQIIKAAETAGLKNEFAKAIKKRIVTRRLIKWGAIITIAVAAFVFYMIKTNLFTHNGNSEGNKETKSFPASEKFDINNSSDTIIETKDGVVFAIPAHAFNSNNTIQLEIKTALNPYYIMQNGLSTMSNNDMLQTAGMFYINGYDNGKQVLLQKEIAVSVPAKNINPAMQLFDGVKDSTGRINWVNPKPVEKRLRTYDITTLDFYPPRYIPTLKALQKNSQNKKYIDSLYYSFSGWPFFRKPYMEVGSIYFPENSALDQYQKDSMYKEQQEMVDKYNKEQQSHEFHYEINPAKIKAIWDKKFNNTIVATKEFEERLKYLHSLCTDEYLNAYLENLNKPLYVIDELIAKNSYGDIKKKFLEFASHKHGGVFVADALQQKLSNYFQQKSKAYKEAAEKTWIKYQAELQRINNIANVKNREEALRNFTREENNFKEELCINLTNAYKQIGVNKNCNDTIVPPADKYYNVTITTTGWKNLDVYVFDATKNRQSMEYKDPATGKTAKLIYKEVAIKIENEQQYDRVLVYLIPDGLSSFQLMQKKENSFKEGLNSLFSYDAIVLAYKGEQVYFYRQTSMQTKEYTFSLSPANEQSIKNILQVYASNKVKDVTAEFEYRLFEQKEALRQMQLRKDEDFREKIAASIFNCGGEGESPRPIESQTK